MRIWDIPVSDLCRQHLLGEHRELHSLWTVITEGKVGYSNHPETKRWIGKLNALYKRHEDEISEMLKRGYKHLSTLDKSLAKGNSQQDTFINPVSEQLKILKKKGCDCRI